MSDDPRTKAYLGDGLYAEFDGFALVLRAPRSGGDHWVSIEPDMLARLVEFVGVLGLGHDEDPPLLTRLIEAARRLREA